MLFIKRQSFANRYYGYSMLHIARFPDSKIWLESTLFRNGVPENLTDMVPLGCVRRPARDGSRNVEMLYLVTVPQDDKQSLNIVQLAACMLGKARVIFFDHALKLLNWMDPARGQLVYCDTVSRGTPVF